MKRGVFLRHLRRHGCYLKREGSRHSLWCNPSTGADVSEWAGSRVAVVLFGEVKVFHRPHLSPDTDKGAVNSIREWLDLHEVKP